jgi:hypothetical protein
MAKSSEFWIKRSADLGVASELQPLCTSCRITYLILNMSIVSIEHLCSMNRKQLEQPNISTKTLDEIESNLRSVGRKLSTSTVEMPEIIVVNGVYYRRMKDHEVKT